MSIGVLLRGFIGDMMDFGDVILRTLFPSFMAIQACTCSVTPWSKSEGEIYLFLRRKSKAWWFPWKSSRQHLFIGCERSYRLSHTLEDISMSTRGVSQLHFSRGSEISTIRCWLMWIVAYTSTHRSRGSRIRQWFLLPSHLPIYYKVTHVCHPCVSFLTNKPSGF